MQTIREKQRSPREGVGYIKTGNPWTLSGLYYIKSEYFILKDINLHIFCLINLH